MCVSDRGEFVQIDTFILHRSPESFGEDVVHTSATAIHADGYVLVFQNVGVLRRGEVTALIGVVDVRCAYLKRSVEIVETEWDLERRR